MKYYTSTTEFNCGIDLHAREMYVCVMDRAGNKLVHTNILGNDFLATETKSYESQWGQQHAAVLTNFAAHILDGTPLIAPGTDGINGVRIANAMHLSAFLSQEVGIDFSEDDYLAELNKRIAAEGKFPQQA